MSGNLAQAARTVVIGVGNGLYTDEGVGPAVVQRLVAEGVPEGVEVIDGAVGGLNLLFDMEGAARVVVVDAAQMGLEPGTVRVFTPEQVRLSGVPDVASLHHIGLKDVLELGALVGVTPEVHIVGVQPGRVAPGLELTAPVAAAVPRALEEVRRLCLPPGEPGAGAATKGDQKEGLARG